ncbi:unnamed protein product [Thelazia callipaeda]|uniref:Apple domain-containing protein n=1 Tax=Thelazia callipaeda TaxID=103827 RepID=A0A0N5CMF6_THECL|nr:unnamed protein product [Thelazia callipaeda]
MSQNNGRELSYKMRPKRDEKECKKECRRIAYCTYYEQMAKKNIKIESGPDFYVPEHCVVDDSINQCQCDRFAFFVPK